MENLTRKPSRHGRKVRYHPRSPLKQAMACSSFECSTSRVAAYLRVNSSINGASKALGRSPFLGGVRAISPLQCYEP
ncbi:hypothetical protein ILUMI_15940 [Ignelater luminosus]|uniref:Uncharacterized protein n=1 Tax=Ignelater luminosus TaxID=2038154 RepID=A0A8K0G9F1_IGNLU|nr:hypothetical protein ILUMI_15940 [Ignelater luminosus]